MRGHGRRCGWSRAFQAVAAHPDSAGQLTQVVRTRNQAQCPGNRHGILGWLLQRDLPVGGNLVEVAEKVGSLGHPARSRRPYGGKPEHQKVGAPPTAHAAVSDAPMFCMTGCLTARASRPQASGTDSAIPVGCRGLGWRGSMRLAGMALGVCRDWIGVV